MIEKEKIIWIYNKLFSIRYFEEKIKQIAKDKSVPGYLHTYIGSEGIAVGVMAALNHDDWITSTYRNHGHAIAKNVSLKEITAEIYGRKNGICKGRGGSMHISDFEKGMLGSFGIVAAGPPVALGAALQEKLNKGKKMTASFFGDGAIHNGAFHEAAGLAKLWNVPILFVCENNNYSIHSRLSDRSAQENLYKFAEVYNIPTHVLKESDIFKLCDLSELLINKIRNGSGPHFIEAYTYRWLEHVGPQKDWDFEYRSKEEIAQWEKDDQVERLRGMLKPLERKNIEKKVKNEVAAAIKFAEQSPFPGEIDLFKNVYK